MSERITPDDFPLDVTAFYGGRARGRCLQFDGSSAQLERHQVEELAGVLAAWLDETAVICGRHERERAALRDRAERHRRDVAECLDCVAVHGEKP